MEMLDTSIANVALPHMAGNLGVTNDESTWVLTSYLVSNAIVLPISGWIAGLVGRKRFFMTCLVLFTVSSLLCGIAPSLALLIVFRIMQGVGGGGLQPMAQAILADTFPPEQRGLAFALYGITAILGPTLGPTLGGWITDNYTWRWIFLINLRSASRVPADSPARRGSAVSRRHEEGRREGGLRRDRAARPRCRRAPGDAGQGAAGRLVRLVLHRRARDACGGLPVALVVWEWFPQQPVIDVRLFRNVNFPTAKCLMFMPGVVLFSSLVLLPQFLQSQMGYSADRGPRAVGQGLVLLRRDADRRPAHDRIPGALSGVVRLAVSRRRPVLHDGHLELLIS